MSKSRAPDTVSRTATVTVSLLLALVVLQLVVVGVVAGGARDHGLTMRRAETMRALYAAEAGMNMAVREVYSASDEDGDGTIGAISADADESNDPSLVTARFSVIKTTSGAMFTLTSTGRCLNSRRAVQAVVQE